MDTQTIELVGRHRLVSELLKAGLEVALPSRDRGVDLIAYLDLEPELGRFVARPIQLKAASRRSFGIWRKYLKINELIIAYVWHLDGEGQPDTYALTCSEAAAIAEALGWTATSSWNNAGVYTTNAPSSELCKLLEPHRMTPEKWMAKIKGSSNGAA
jgi:hypothetical protein